MSKEEYPFPPTPTINSSQHGCAHTPKSTEFKSKNRISLTNTFSYIQTTIHCQSPTNTS